MGKMQDYDKRIGLPDDITLSKDKIKSQDANCPRCAMLCEQTNIRYFGKKQYQNFYCYECKSPFSILLKGETFKNLINKD